MTLHTPPDPLLAIAYVALFAAITVLAMRRPAYGVCALILVQPFALYGDVFTTTITLPKIVLLGVLLGICVQRDVFAPLAQRPAWQILLAGSFVVIATAASYLQAAYHTPVIRESLKALEYVVLFVVVVAAYRADPDRRAIRAAALVVTVAVASLALVQGIIRTPSAFLMNGHPLPRIAGPLEGPNQLAGYMDVALPLSFVLCVEEATGLAMLALFLAAFADVLTFSRGGAIGAIAGLLTAAFTLRRDLRHALITLGAGVLAGLGVAVSWGVAAHTFALARFWNLSAPSGGGVGSRPVLWRSAVELWRRHPWLGLGAGNFELEIPLTGVRGVRTHANSLYLQSLVEGGIPLLAATLWLTYVSIAAFAGERLRSPLVAAALAASIALALHQTIDFLTFYPKIGGWWWIVLALGAAEVTAPVLIRGEAWA